MRHSKLFSSAVFCLKTEQTAPIGSLFAPRTTGAKAALYSAITNGCVRTFVDESGKIESLFSAVPLDLFRQAKDVFILTYLWEASITCAYLKSEGIDYDYWYVDRSDDAKMLTPEEQPFVPSVGIRELICFDTVVPACSLPQATT